MSRRRSLLAALGALGALGVLSAVGLAPLAQATPGTIDTASTSKAAKAQATRGSPLKVTIDSLSPSTIPKRGPIRVTGTLTNRDEVTWTTVNLYSFVSQEPITTRAGMAEAAATRAVDFVGNRITDFGTDDRIERIDPGESRPFSLRVSHRALAAQSPGVYADSPGVYWFGVHALGQNDEGRPDDAVGRARTFMPLVGASRAPLQAALVLSIRHDVSYAEDGSLEDVTGWTSTLSAGGRLRSMVDFGAQADGRAISWLVDPAVVDAVRRLAAGNPARSLAPTFTPDPSGGGSTGTGDGGDTGGDNGNNGGESPSPTPGGDEIVPPGETPSPSTPDLSSLDPETADAARAAASWLDQFRGALADGEILTLPYGDVDQAGAAEHDSTLYERARARSGTELGPFGLRTSPVVAAPSGYIDATAVRAVENGTPILATDLLVGTDPATVLDGDGHRIVVTSSGAAAGGPAPNDPLDPLSLRQRILAEAAVRTLHRQRAPLVVALPDNWMPSSSEGFYPGLDVPWLNLTSVGDIAAGPARPVDLDSLTYPASQRSRELGPESFAAAEGLSRSGEALQNILTVNDQVGATLSDQALTSTSYATRRDPRSVLASVAASESWVNARLGAVRISAPRAVTLSSADGQFPTTVANDLDEPVSVTIDSRSDDQIRIGTPVRVDLPAGGRRTLLLDASSSQIGQHTVTLMLSDGNGVMLGASDELPIRSGQVSQVIWLFLGTGAALIFGAIAVRLVRRVRAARRGPAGEPA